MAHAYATIANNGQRVGGSILFHTPDSGITDPSMEPVSIKRIQFPDGTEYVNTPVAVQVVPKDDALEVTQAMKGVITDGTGTSAKIGRPAAGKTGTTSDFKDAWFVGSTPQRTTAVWVGYENPARPMRTQYNGSPVYGGTFPALIWSDFMRNAMRGQDREDWETPVGVPTIPVSVDPRTVERVSPNCKYAQVVVWAESLAPLDMGPCESDLISVPDFTAANKRKANSLATGSGLLIRFQYRPAQPGENPGTVVVQSPSPLTAVQPGSVVTLIIARKIPSILVPNVVATANQPSTIEGAIARLQAAQFRVIIVDQQSAEGLPLRSVVAQNPSSGKPAPLGAVITVSASGDYKGTIVPNVAGKTVAEAQTELEQAGLIAGAINADGLLNPADRVFSIEPSPNSKVPRGTKITLYVSPF
jgi:hypothetical protein